MSASNNSPNESPLSSRPNMRSLFMRASFSRAKSLPTSVRSETQFSARPIRTETTIWRSGNCTVVMKPPHHPASNAVNQEDAAKASSDNTTVTSPEPATPTDQATPTEHVTVAEYHEACRLYHDAEIAKVQAKQAERARYERACRQAQEAKIALQGVSRQSKTDREECVAIEEVIEESGARDVVKTDVSRRRRKVEAWLDGTAVAVEDETECRRDLLARKQKDRAKKVLPVAPRETSDIELRPWDEDAVGLDCDY